MRSPGRALAALVVLVLAVATGVERATAAVDWEAAGDEAVALLAEYLKIDTTNPPGNETRAAEFLKAVFDREGIEARVIESAPGRGSVWARLKGDGTRKAVVLLNHLDVVPADPRQWSVPPFAGLVRHGAIWGRGALDMKGQAILQLIAMVLLKREQVPLRGDVIFLGTADEEMGGRMGAGFIAREHLDLVRDAGVVLNEGGAISQRSGRAAFYGVSVSEKLPFGLRLVATGPAGHGSTPRPDSAVNKLVAAVGRIIAHQTPLRVTDEVQRYYAAIAHLEPSPRRERWQDLRASLEDPGFAAEFTRSAFNNAQVRNTIAVTMLQGSSKSNVIPGEATAYLDVRLLPGDDPQTFVAEIARVIDDSSIRIESRPPVAASSSPVTHELFRVLAEVAGAFHPGAFVTPTMLQGFTDCHYFRAKGIPCYGFVPLQIPAPAWNAVHGNDEHVPVDAMKSATRLMLEILLRLAK